MPYNPVLYRPCVGICLINKDGLVFAGERIDRPNAWQMPQGGTDGDAPEIAVMRELQEEIGTDKAKIIGHYPQTLYYDLPPHLQEKLWNGQFKGQSQDWFYLRFTGQDSDIDINADQKPEFSQWEWLTPADIMDKIVPFKRTIYEQVFSHLAQHL